MSQPPAEPPASPVYPIVPDGPATVILNHYSALHRIVIPRPPKQSPPPTSSPGK